jgi:transcriptional regulator
MYEPPHFKVDDRDPLFEVFRAHPLGLLVTAGPNGLMANPIPFTLAGENGAEMLRAHLARANPQWRDIEAGAEPLVIFQSIDHYVSPSWYATKRETGKVVPTWNYIIVQVRGTARIDTSAAYLRAQIYQLTDAHEGSRAAPWRVEDASETFIAAQMKGIVGIEITIREITGKFKLSQNRNEADQRGVEAGLAGETGADAAAMRHRIAAHLARRTS